MHIPLSTYRVQFNNLFGFEKCKYILSYLKSLGITDIYASPVLKARKGSQHGYDVVDPLQINPELGGNEAFDRLINSVKTHGLFWLQDIVPNHMAYDSENRLLMDIFEQRDNSRYFNFFDIDWNHRFKSFEGRVLAPFLGSHYSEILDKREIKISFDENGFSVNYYSLKFPLLLSSYKDILLYSIVKLEEKIGKTSPQYIKYLGMCDLFGRISQDAVKHYYNQVQHAKTMLWQLYLSTPDVKEFIDSTIAGFNGEGDEYIIDSLDELLSKQCYRLSFWKVASEELNYRRFFTINELISLHIEKNDIFKHAHNLIIKLIGEGKINALRIDHIDGIYDPAAYLNHLRKNTSDLYIVVEKILALQEDLSDSLTVQGTTGYDFMNYVTGLFYSKDNDRSLKGIYYKFSNIQDSYTKIVQDKKRLIIRKHMAGDIDNLAQLMKKVAGNHRFGRDITLYGLRRALVEVIAFFPVYRTYSSPRYSDSKDKAYILDSIDKALNNAPVLKYEIEFIKKFLLLELQKSLTEEEKKPFWRFIMKFQQLTAPIMAKGFEDTVFYSYNKNLALNEVGGEPSHSGVNIDDFFAFINKRSQKYPYSFNATSTHDTKRGEDVRARLTVLTEIPADWKKHLSMWSSMNRHKKIRIRSVYCPDRNDEYFIYQTLLGSFPFPPFEMEAYTSRIKEYIIKAVREAKVNSAWINPDPKYERACVSFIDRLLNQDTDNSFYNSFSAFSSYIAHFGIFTGLSQLVIKAASPGVPDFYQGTELWDLHLVDPDNRRPVDYELRKKYLTSIKEGISTDTISLIKELLEHKDDGRVKLFLMHQLLQMRNRYSDLFLKGDFLPLKVEGTCSRSVIVFARRYDNTWALVISPRFLTQIVKETGFPLGREVWQDTVITAPEPMPENYYNCITHQIMDITGNLLYIGDILSHFPVAVLVSSEKL